MPRKTYTGAGAGVGFFPASMRPRPDAAENILRRRPVLLRDAASMRPRPDAAENAPFATRCDSKCSPPRRERSRTPDRQAKPAACRLTMEIS